MWWWWKNTAVYDDWAAACHYSLRNTFTPPARYTLFLVTKQDDIATMTWTSEHSFHPILIFSPRTFLDALINDHIAKPKVTEQSWKCWHCYYLYFRICDYTKIWNSTFFFFSSPPLLPVSSRMESGNLTSLFFIMIKYSYKICQIYMVYPQNTRKLPDETNLSLILSPLIFLNTQICIVLCDNIRKVLIASFSYYIYYQPSHVTI